MTNADRLNLSPDSLERAGRIIDILAHDFGLAPRGARRLVIGIAGESGSGKSVAASSLAHELRARGYTPQVIYQDDYFVRPPRTNHEFRMRDVEAHVGPHEVQLALIAEHMAAFRERRDVEGPLVDYPGNRFVTQPLPFATSDVLVVEGTYVLGLAGLDVRIFCSATHEETRARRDARNRDIQDPMVDRVLAIEHRLIAPYGATADLVIDRDFQLHRRAGPAAD
jgi:uridine kinase